MRDYSEAYAKAIRLGVDFKKDFHAQAIGGQMHELAKIYGYRKPKNANGSTGRYFFYLLQRRYAK
jgi:hypothetical protein